MILSLIVLKNTLSWFIFQKKVLNLHVLKHNSKADEYKKYARESY